MKNLEELLQNGEYKNLIAGTEVAPMVRGITLESGQGILQYGSVLGLVSYSGFGILVDKTASDGSKLPIGILAETVDTGEKTESVKKENETESDASQGDTSMLQEPVLAQMYITGVFNKDALLFAEGTTFEDMELELKKLGIYTKKMYE